MNCIEIILSILLIFILFGISIYSIYKDIHNRINTYIYPKTGNKYKVIKECKMKDISTGDWYTAVLYKSVTDGMYYVREKEDFYFRFIELEEYK